MPLAERYWTVGLWLFAHAVQCFVGALRVWRPAWRPEEPSDRVALLTFFCSVVPPVTLFVWIYCGFLEGASSVAQMSLDRLHHWSTWFWCWPFLLFANLGAFLLSLASAGTKLPATAPQLAVLRRAATILATFCSIRVVLVFFPDA